MVLAAAARRRRRRERCGSETPSARRRGSGLASAVDCPRASRSTARSAGGSGSLTRARVRWAEYGAAFRLETPAAASRVADFVVQPRECVQAFGDAHPEHARRTRRRKRAEAGRCADEGALCRDGDRSASRTAAARGSETSPRNQTVRCRFSAGTHRKLRDASFGIERGAQRRSASSAAASAHALATARRRRTAARQTKQPTHACRARPASPGTGRVRARPGRNECGPTAAALPREPRSRRCRPVSRRAAARSGDAGDRHRRAAPLRRASLPPSPPRPAR